MATVLNYTVSAYVPFTKILSANINQDKTDIQNRINWAGGSDAATGLGDDNVQSNTATGGGLTRATKLKLGTFNAIAINSPTGALSDLATSANQTIYISGTGIPTVGVLPAVAGGTGAVLVPTNVGDTLQVLPGITIGLGAAPTPAAVRVFNFYQFS